MEFLPQSDEPQREFLPQSDESQSDEPQSDEPQSDFLGISSPLPEPDDKLIPKSGMIFKSEEEVYNFYLEYACEVGFGIRRKSMKKDDNGKLKYYSVECARGGTWKSVAKNAFNPRPSRKTNCKAKINAIVYDGELTISHVNLEHNHALSPKKAHFIKCNKNMDAYVKRRLETNDQAGIRLSKKFHSLAVEVEGYENLTFAEKDCRNHILKVRQIRLGVGDAASLSRYFACMQKRNPNFFYLLDIDDDSRLKNVFWADARSIAAYETFGDVISFDTTYLTNRYDMPLVSFVGVNHHGQTILFGCGLLSNEEADTYIWLFKAWLVCMSNAPNAIVTDQCKSIQKAVKSAFPNSHHRLCLWHIVKKLPEKLGSRHDYKQIKKVLKKAVYESIEVQEFEEIWANMINDFDLNKNTWLSDLYEDRHRWVPVFVKGTFWAGMSTTQRSDSINAFFDGYVGPKTSLKQFVEQYDNALKSKIEKENKADFASFNSHIPVKTDFYFEKQLQDAYTNELFRLFQDELWGLVYCNLTFLDRYESISTFQVTDILRSKDGALRNKVTYVVCYDEAKLEFKCSCRLFEFKGIICRHTVKVFIQKNIKSVPSQYILHRWRKDVRHKHSYVKNCYDDGKDDECRVRYNNLYSQCSKAIEIGVESVENYQFLMRCLDEATSKLMDNSINWNKQSAEATSTVKQKMNKKKSAQASKSKKDHSESQNAKRTKVQGSLESTNNLYEPSEPSTVNQFDTQESSV